MPWQTNLNEYHPQNHPPTTTKKLKPGIYSYHVNDFGWFLRCDQEKFEFPFKIYGHRRDIIDHISIAWTSLSTNLGVLLNGLKGTGKTVTAQEVCNWCVDNDIPVLVVESPLPLAVILAHIRQDICVLFDEFEKTHPVTDEHDQQQGLLSLIDGTHRSHDRRLFLFTTNTAKLNDNFINRPSRIRYRWQFGQLEPKIILELIDDLLDPALVDLRTPLLSYIDSREVISIDVVKAIIQETNIFKSDPWKRDCFNLTERTPWGFRMVIDGKEEFITMTNGQAKHFRSMLIGGGAEFYGTNFHVNGNVCAVQVVGAVEDKFQVRLWRDPETTDWKATSNDVSAVLCCQRSSDFRLPGWLKKLKKNQILTEKEQSQYDEWVDAPRDGDGSDIYTVTITTEWSRPHEC